MGKSTQHWTETEHDFNRLKLLIEGLVHFRFMDESKLELIELILQTIYAEGLNFHGLDEPSEYSIYEMYLKTKDKYSLVDIIGWIFFSPNLLKKYNAAGRLMK